MKQANYECDLHCHTTRSDGKDSPKELIDKTAGLGLKAIAITDHDITPPESIEIDGKSIPILEYADKQGVLLLRGMEISCDTQIEDVHLIAFGCDFRDIRFKDLESEVARSKIESYKEFVKRLNENGYPITWSQVLKRNGVMIDEHVIQKKMIFETMAELNHAPSWKEAKNLSQTHPNLKVLRHKPDPVDIIDLIHQTGGICILAHPYLIDPPDKTTDQYIDRLIDAGLDGIETSYAYSATNYRGSLSDIEIELHILATCILKGLIVSGGSDYHGDTLEASTYKRELGGKGITYAKFLKYGYMKLLG